MRFLDQLLSDERKEILNDQEKVMIKYLKETYEESTKFPSEVYFLDKFPEYSVPLDGAKELSKHDLEIHFTKMVADRSRKLVGSKIMKIASNISGEGFTDEINEEIRKVYMLNREVDLDDAVMNIGKIKEIYERKKNQPTGLLTFVDEIDDKIGGLSKGTVNVIFGYTGHFKCINEDERVPTSKGLLKMKDIYSRFKNKERFEILSEEGSRDIKAVHDDGVKESYIIKTDTGNEIETSPVHRFRVITSEGNIEWRKAMNIEVDDKLIMSKQESVWGDKEKNLELCYLHGLLLGDGYIYVDDKGKAKVNLIGEAEDLESIGFRDIFNKLFYGCYSVTEEKREKDYKLLYNVRTDGRMSDFVKEEFGYMIGHYAYDKVFPEWIYEASQECVSMFLRGLFDSGGTSSESNSIIFTTTSEDMANGISLLLRNFGIRVAKRKYQYDDGRPFYSIKILTLESRIKFKDEIGFGLDRKMNNINVKDSVNNVDVLYNLKPILCDFADDALVPREMSHSFQFRNRDTEVTRKNFKNITDFYREYNLKIYHKTLKYFLEHDVYVDKVVDIDKDKSYMYDLTVEGSPTYVVNQFITHNTAFSNNIAYNNVYDLGYNVVYISLEVPKEHILYNMMSRHSFRNKFSRFPYVSHSKMKKYALSEEEEDFIFSEVLDDFREEQEGELIVLDETDFKNFTFSDIRSRLEVVDEELDGGIDAIFWDHANLFKFSGEMGRGMSQYDIINEYVSFIREISIKWLKDEETGDYRQLTNVILAQANRQGFLKANRSEGRYDLTAIAEANELERAAYRVFSIYTNENLKQSKEASMQILKNRSGPTMYDPLSVFADPEPYVVGESVEGFSDTIDENDFDSVFGDDSGFDI